MPSEELRYRSGVSSRSASIVSSSSSESVDSELPDFVSRASLVLAEVRLILMAILVLSSYEHMNYDMKKHINAQQV